MGPVARLARGPSARVSGAARGQIRPDMLALSCAAALVALLAAVAYVAWRGRVKTQAQRLLYAAAERRAQATGKPLVVVGDPTAPRTLNSFFGAGNGCGDLCVDIAGAPGCPRAVAAPVLDWLRLQPDDSAVIFESEVLIYVPAAELETTIDELFRVSGGDLFAAHSNAVNSLRYTRTGAPQPVRNWLARSRFLTFDRSFLRAFVAYPPHGAYSWVELDPAQSAGCISARRSYQPAGVPVPGASLLD